MNRDDHAKQMKSEGKELALHVTGNTFHNKEHLKKAGAEWHEPSKGWILPHKAANEIVAKRYGDSSKKIWFDWNKRTIHPHFDDLPSQHSEEGHVHFHTNNGGVLALVKQHGVIHQGKTHSGGTSVASSPGTFSIPRTKTAGFHEAVAKAGFKSGEHYHFLGQNNHPNHPPEHQFEESELELEAGHVSVERAQELVNETRGGWIK